jgi:hypothetical protein
MATGFYPVESYSIPRVGYRLLPFRFLKLDSANELLVNEVREFVIAPHGTAHSCTEAIDAQFGPLSSATNGACPRGICLINALTGQVGSGTQMSG